MLQWCPPTTLPNLPVCTTEPSRSLPCVHTTRAVGGGAGARGPTPVGPLAWIRPAPVGGSRAPGGPSSAACRQSRRSTSRPSTHNGAGLMGVWLAGSRPEPVEFGSPHK